MNLGKIICNIIGSGVYIFSALYINHVYTLSTTDFIILLVAMGVVGLANFTEGLLFTNRG